MRKYQPIWNTIKSEGKCTISASPTLHKRIKRAVYKEKYADIGFKVEWDLKGDLQPELQITLDKKNKNILIFNLLKPITLGDL